MLGLCAAAVTAGSMLEVYRFRVDAIRAPLAGLRAPLHVAWLCDLHYGPFIRAGSVAAWVDATLELRPDAVLLGGDLVDVRSEEDITPLLEQLARLHAPLGVFAIWGNHDVLRFRHTRPTLEESLGRAGITVLRNASVALRHDLHLMGLDDLRTGRPDLEVTLANRPSGVGTLLLSHNPDVLPNVPTSVGLTLAGHTHGGQIRLPGIGPLVTSSRYGRRFAHGWVNGPARGYVSRGLGVSQLPLRLNCPAELTSLLLTPAG